mmetsp:Transcript_78640/g.138671  ORF Transcript_78640/g.138671 Transcript_78640/m.138671 type:complete len:116 (-) Transcript_78640:1048-1395(-)
MPEAPPVTMSLLRRRLPTLGELASEPAASACLKPFTKSWLTSKPVLLSWCEGTFRELLVEFPALGEPSGLALGELLANLGEVAGEDLGDCLGERLADCVGDCLGELVGEVSLVVG